jgi:hypothetical protein
MLLRARRRALAQEACARAVEAKPQTDAAPTAPSEGGSELAQDPSKVFAVVTEP